jgi:hypothetical protein
MNAASQSVLSKAEFLGPTSHRESHPAKGDELRGFGVLHLLSWGRPSAIRWLVVSIVVDALKRMSVAGSSTHVGDEVLVTHPPLADRDSATAISDVSRIARLLATMFHFLPSLVFGGSVAAMLYAAATAGRRWAEFGDVSNEFFPAHADTLPVRSAVHVREPIYAESSKRVTDKVVELWHSVILPMNGLRGHA